VSYVDAGYAVALGGVALYALSLVVRRRRWERALKMSERPVAGGENAPARRERP